MQSALSLTIKYEMAPLLYNFATLMLHENRLIVTPLQIDYCSIVT